jgi:isochorismate pyruvate lyase
MSLDSLDDVRSRIDHLDAEIIALIAQRQACVARAGELKPPGDAAAVRAPARVEQVIDKVRGHAVTAGASPDVVEATYRAMIGAFIELEHGINNTAR